jgi:SAM-dependent MidA family methyltransferase
MEAAGPMSDALHWRFVERFDRVRSWQRRRLGTAATSAEWAPRLGEPPVAAGCVLANEVLDNFPVHALEVIDGDRVGEIYVDTDGNHLVERLGPLSTPDLAGPARQAASHLDEGARFELCPELEVWCCEAARALERGYLVLVDYGDVQPDVWLDNPQGTLVTHGPADAGPSPLDDPGSKDITAKVNFSAVLQAAEAAGFCPEPLVSQRTWLLSLGLAQLRTRSKPLGSCRPWRAGWSRPRCCRESSACSWSWAPSADSAISSCSVPARGHLPSSAPVTPLHDDLVGQRGSGSTPARQSSR